MADRVWRAYGILSYARIISGQEALTLFSEVRLGIDLGIITAVPAEVFNELLVTTRPNFLQKIAGRPDIDPGERDGLRAQLIREKLLKKGGKTQCLINLPNGRASVLTLGPAGSRSPWP